MAILSRITRRAKILGALALALGVGLVGCEMMEGKSGPKKPTFDHKLHVEDQGLECANCHAGADTADAPGMPTLAQCQLCHAEIDAEKPPDQQVASLFVNDELQTSYKKALTSEILFPHSKHAEAGLDCAACHDSILGDGKAETPIAPTRMSACMDCHAVRNAPNDCATCHATIRADVPAPSHDANWLRQHGKVFRAKDERTSSSCSICHTESSCNTCHLAQAPENHTVYWRERAHAFNARMDRSTCMACHKPDSCDRCHSYAQPANHVGAWGSPKSNHCQTCHLPLKSQGCSVCHRSTPSHDLAPPKPPVPPHNAAMNCRMCHGNGQRLPHFDNGDNCNSCHK